MLPRIRWRRGRQAVVAVARESQPRQDCRDRAPGEQCVDIAALHQDVERRQRAEMAAIVGVGKVRRVGTIFRSRR